MSGKDPEVLSHPLDPLSPEEVGTAYSILTSQEDIGEDSLCIKVELKEPLKDTLQAYENGGDIPERRARIVVRNSADRKTIEAIVSLDREAVTEFEHVYQTLIEEGFTVIAEPTKSFEEVGTTVELAHQQRGFRIDLFEQQVVGKVWLTDQMRRRAEQFWTGNHVTAFTLSDEDMFLLKAVSGGDIASGRQRDLEDMRIYAQRGIDYETVLDEIEAQRPFNTGATEAQQIRDRSHPCSRSRWQ